MDYTRDFSKAKTSVFLDVEDFPNPNGRSYYEIIKSALVNQGYHGDVSITAYGEKKPDNLDDVITFVTKRGKYTRLNKMLVDIAFWAVDNPDAISNLANLMVIAKNIPEETEFVDHVQSMQTFNYNVMLVVADDCAQEEVPLPDVKTIWFWESLLDGAKPLDRTQRCSLLARVKRVVYRTQEDSDDDDTPCPICGN